MKFPKISIVHNRLNYKSKTGFSPVYLRIYFKGKADFVILDQVPSVNKRDWIGDAKQDLYVVNPQINRAICEILHQARVWTQERILRGDSLTIDEIKQHLKIARTNETFNQYIDRFITNLNKNKSDHEKLEFRTIQTYRSFELRFNEFRPDVSFDELGATLVRDFERWLSVTKNMRGVTRAKHFSKFRICYKGALKEGLAKYDDRLLFDDIKIKVEKSRRVSLTEEEIRLFRDTKLDNPRKEFYKNIFLLVVLTGVYYSDVQMLKVSNIEEVRVNENGEEKKVLVLSANRSKNGEPYAVPIFSDAKKILVEFSNWPEKKEGPLFDDLISDTKFRENVKAIAKLLGIKKNVTVKVGRHSFGELMLSWGIPSFKVSGAMGHSGSDITEQIYGRQSKSNAVRGWGDFKL